jgi:hypothetical protein
MTSRGPITIPLDRKTADIRTLMNTYALVVDTVLKLAFLVGSVNAETHSSQVLPRTASSSSVVIR